MAHPHDPAELIAIIGRELHLAEGLLPSRPGCAAGLIREAAEDLCRLTLKLGPSRAFLIDRLRFNLQVAKQHAEIAPDVAAAYARGCRFELGKLAEELAKHAEEARR